MSLFEPLPLILVVIGALPFAWSGLVSAAHGAASRGRAPGTRMEAAVLALMIAPAAIGAIVLILAPIAPEAVSPPVAFSDFFSGPGRDAASTASGLVQATPPVTDLWPIAAAMIGALYLLGAASAVARLLRARARLDRIVAEGRPAAALGERVRVTAEVVSPFASARGVVVLPRALVEALPAEQIALIAAHERIHIERGDPRVFAALAWIDAALWFNPFIRRQTRRCRLAIELACDEAIVSGAPHLRGLYARSFVSAVKHALEETTREETALWAPSIHSPPAHGEHHMRLSQILTPTPSRPRRSGWVGLAAAAALAAPLTLVQVACAQTPSTKAAEFTVLPLEGHVSSAFGRRNDPFTGEEGSHTGVDIVAPRGAPIVAPADGVVTYVGERGGYGNVVELDHGGGVKTRFGQLESYDVAKDDRVQAGDVIGGVGSSGRSTGPHLHWEIWRDDLPTDPAPVMASLGFVDTRP